MFSNKKVWSSLLLVLSLVGCGGGGGDSADETVDPMESPIVGSAELQPNARVVSASLANRMDFALAQGRIELSNSDAADFQAGQTLVVDKPEVPLLKVVSTAPAGGNRTVLNVEETSLAGVFKELHFQIDGDLGSKRFVEPGDLGGDELALQWVDGSKASTAGRAQAAASGTADVMSLQFKHFGASLGRGVDVTGNASFRVNPYLNIDLVPGAPGTPFPDTTLEMTAKVSPQLRASVQLSSKYGGAISLSKGEEFKLGSVRWLVPAGPVLVPVWVTFNAGVSMQAEGSFASEFLTTRTYEGNGELGFSKTRLNGLQPISSYTSDQTLNVENVGGAGAVTVTPLKIELMAYLYNAAGPTFDISASGEVKGALDVQGTPSVEGVAVTGTVAIKANANLKARVPINDLLWVPPLLRDVGVEYTAFSLELAKREEVVFTKFFPFNGVAAIVVRDNGSAADDIFEVALDGTVMGYTSKGGSGQFRIKNLRPGEHTLRLKTVEDDSPPGTWQITLNDGLTFSDGYTTKSGSLSLGSSTSFTVLVP